MIKDVFKSSSANWLPCLISQVDSALMSKGIWNHECAVLPFGNNKAAIPEVATGRTIFDSDLSLEIIVFHKNVFPVPPCPFIKISVLLH